MAEPETHGIPSWVVSVQKLQRPFTLLALTVGVVVLSIKGEIPWSYIGGAFTTILGHLFGERAALKQPKDGGM